MKRISPSQAVNIGSELLQLIRSLKPSVQYSPVDLNVWEQFLENAKIRENLELHHQVCAFSQTDVPWTWEWDNNILTIELSDLSQGHISKTSVSLPKLQGKWWAPLEDISVTTNDQSMKITARCSHIPLLIRSGGEIDPHSKFFLGMLAIYNNSVPFFISWMSEAADAGEPNAQQFLGRFLMKDVAQQRTAVYWLARSVLEHNDPKSVVALCSLLWNGDDSLRNIPLAENLLASSCNDGNLEALFELGCLYLKTSPSRRKLAVSLLKEASSRGVTEAEEILEQISETPTSWADALVATGIAAAAALGVAYLVKKMRRK